MKKASSHPLTSAQQAEIDALVAMPDEEINTEDIPEISNWHGMQRGLFSHRFRFFAKKENKLMATAQLQEKSYSQLLTITATVQEHVGHLQAQQAATQVQLAALQEELVMLRKALEERERKEAEQAQRAASEEEFDEMEWRRKLSEMTEEQLQAMVPATPALAALVEEELDEREWDAIVSHPAFQQDIEKLEEEVKENIAAGRVIEWKPGESFEDLLRSQVLESV